MSDPITACGTLKLIAPYILKSLKYMRGNRPVNKAIVATHDRFRTRIPDLNRALQTWVGSAEFQAELVSIDTGDPPQLDIAHVESFIKVSGISLGAGSFETTRESLVFFCTQLQEEYFASEEGMRMVARALQDIQRKLPTHTSAPESSSIQNAPFRPQLDTDDGLPPLSIEDQTAGTQLDIVRTLINKRQPRTALNILDDLVPDVVSRSLTVRLRFFLNKGVCHLLLSEFDQAYLEFERAKALEPLNRKVLINVAQTAVIRQKFDYALDALAPVLSKDPADGDANAIKISVLHGLGRDGEINAIVSEHESILNHPHCLYTLAFVASDRQSFDEAEHYVRLHNSIDDKNPEAWELLGRMIFVPLQEQLRQIATSPNWIPQGSRNRIAEAEGCFSKAELLAASSEVQTDLKYIYANRGTARLALGKSDEARKDFEHALRIDPTLAPVKQNLARLCLLLDQDSQALALLEQLPMTAETVPLVATAYLRLSQPAKAHAALSIIDASDSLLIKDLMLWSAQQMKDEPGSNALLGELASLQNEPEAFRISADYYARAGDLERATELLKQAVERAAPGRAGRYRLYLADLLYKQQSYAEAADQYELAQVPFELVPESKRYVAALYAAGRLSKALDAARTIRGEQPAVAWISEIEALVLESLGNLPAAVALRQALLALGENPNRQRLKIAVNYARIGQPDNARPLVLHIEVDELGDDAELLQDAAFLRTILGLPDALAFALRLLDVASNEPIAHLFYINTFFPREEIDKPLFEVEIASIDSTVTLLHKDEVLNLTIVRGTSEAAQGRQSADEGLAKALIGKKIGDIVRYPEGESSESRYQIQAIRSKYVATFQDTIARFNERFGVKYGLTRFELDPNDPTKLIQMLARKRAQGQHVLDLYGKGRLPACTLARLFGKSDAAMFRSLLEDSTTRVLSYYGTSDQLGTESATVASGKGLLLDSSALVTLHSLGMLDKLHATFSSIFVTQQTIDSLRETVADCFPEKQSGFLTIDEFGSPHVIENNADQVREQQRFYQALLSFAESQCSIAAPPDTAPVKDLDRPTTKQMLGPAATSTIAVALTSVSTLVSDDRPLRDLVKNTGQLASIGTFAILRHLRSSACISGDDYHAAIWWLVQHRVTFVSIDKLDVLWVMRRDNWTPSADVALMLQNLAGPEATEQLALQIGMDLLNQIWSEPLLPETKQLFSDLLLRTLITGRNATRVVQVLQAMNDQRSFIWTPAAAAIRAVLRNWRQPRGFR